MVSSQMMCVASYTIFSRKWKGHVHILHIHLAAMELPTLTTEASFLHGLRFKVQQSIQQIVPPHAPRELDERRKASYGHPSLTTSIFTVYCPHGVHYGFKIMWQCESQRHPFIIFTSHFPVPLGTTVYDNGCKLHSYCLNREPALYKGTRFFIDRFHWRGNVGCSKGYCLDEHNTAEVRSLNSQVNEQANSQLQRIK